MKTPRDSGGRRRRFPRYKFHVDAHIEYESRIRRGRVSNISRGGMFIRMADPPRVNERFSAYLALDTPLRVDCVVRHVVPRLGIGVSLTVPEEQRVRFDALLLALAGGADPASTHVNPPPSESVRTTAKSAGA